MRLTPSCYIDGEMAVAAAAPDGWQGGSAYFTDGKTLRIKRWGAKAPPDCRPVE